MTWNAHILTLIDWANTKINVTTPSMMSLPPIQRFCVSGFLVFFTALLKENLVRYDKCKDIPGKGNISSLIDMLNFMISRFLMLKTLPVQGHQLNFHFSDLLTPTCLKKLDDIWPIWLLNTFTDIFSCGLWHISHFEKPEVKP